MPTRADLPELFALAAEPPDGPLRLDPREGIRRGRRRRRRQVGAVLAAVVVVAAGVAVPVAVSEQPQRHPSTLTATSPPTSPAPAGADLANLLAGHWSTLPAAPIAPRGGASVVWTGKELLVWGGASGNVLRGDGAAYNPSTRTWRTLPASPLSAREGQSAVWTGTEMIVWGGYDEVSQTHFRVTSDGAAYDPSTNRWHLLPASPLSPRADAYTVWTGSEMIVLGGHPAVLTDTVRGFPDGAQYDPATGRWHRLPTPTPPDGHGLVWAATVQTSGRLLAWSEWSTTQTTGPNSSSTTAGIDLFAYDEQDASWRLLPSAATSSPVPEQVLWTGQVVIVRGAPHYCGGCFGPPITDATSAYDPATDTWTRLPADPLGGSHNVLASTGQALISFNAGGQIGPIVPGDASGYDPATRTWAMLPAAPFGCGPFDPVWTGQELLAYCSPARAGASRASGLAFTPGAVATPSGAPAQLPRSGSALQFPPAEILRPFTPTAGCASLAAGMHITSCGTFQNDPVNQYVYLTSRSGPDEIAQIWVFAGNGYVLGRTASIAAPTDDEATGIMITSGQREHAVITYRLDSTQVEYDVVETDEPMTISAHGSASEVAVVGDQLQITNTAGRTTAYTYTAGAWRTNRSSTQP